MKWLSFVAICLIEALCNLFLIFRCSTGKVATIKTINRNTLKIILKDNDAHSRFILLNSFNTIILVGHI